VVFLGIDNWWCKLQSHWDDSKGQMSRLFGVIAMKVKLLMVWYKQIWSAGCTCDSHITECRV